MKKFYSVDDVADLDELIQTAIRMKNNPNEFAEVGKNKLIVLLFFNPSLRTKLSTQKAAMNLGMQVIPMDMSRSWGWEFEDGIKMEFDTAEHVKEAANVISRYADIIAIRSFPGLKDKEKDYADSVVKQFIRYCPKPVINLESAIRHPLQSFADLMTITEHVSVEKPKIVLSWAPHPKALPQAVSNSFLEWMKAAGHQVTVTHPEGYELDVEFMDGHEVEHNQDLALKDADVVYVKNWSSVKSYGQILSQDSNWTITKNKLDLTNKAKLLHCLPVRRNVVLADDAIDSDHSVIYDLAENRLHTAQAVIYKILSEVI
ncbi:MAG: N-succinyl-L-ornithine transcarbamylase [Saprospiraceae bacterium]|jgi:N-succinyl-L-ornithine transcarbamylase